MAANTAPAFTKGANNQWAPPPVLAANTTTDLTSGTIYLVATTDATNGGYVRCVCFQPLGTNIATVGRIWLNNGSTTGTAANNTQLADVTLPGTAVSQVAAIGKTEVALGFWLDPGYKIYVTLGTAVAAGFDVTALMGKY